MREPIEIPKYTSPQRAIRLALGKTGYNDAMQTLGPDLIVWAIEASDMISKPRTFVADDCEFTVCDNKIQLPEEALMINCLSRQCGTPMSFLGSKGCTRINRAGSSCNCGGEGGFYLDSCYAHFKPCLPDGTLIHLEWLVRPIDEQGYPMVLDSSTQAISEYVASMVCLRYESKMYNIWNEKWLHHVRLARSYVNRIFEQNIVDLGQLYHALPSQQFGNRGAWAYGRPVTV